jgi:hypothetical protein
MCRELRVTLMPRRSGDVERNEMMKFCRVCVIGALVAVLVSGKISSVRADDANVITVMTQNLYQGTELEHAIAATNVQQLLAGVATDYSNVIATSFPQRADAIATEIAQSGPALVGLQEVALWRTQTPYNPASPPQTVSYDFLQILLDALAAHGLHYTTVIARNNYTLAGAGAFPSRLMGISLTDRSAILARTDLPADQLTLSNPQQGSFQHGDVTPTAAGKFSVGSRLALGERQERGQSLPFRRRAPWVLSYGDGTTSTGAAGRPGRNRPPNYSFRGLQLGTG